MDTIAAEHAEPDILITERKGHASDLARAAVERGAQIVVAWGGDGTVNEVASALVGSAASLGLGFLLLSDGPKGELLRLTPARPAASK